MNGRHRQCGRLRTDASRSKRVTLTSSATDWHLTPDTHTKPDLTSILSVSKHCTSIAACLPPRKTQSITSPAIPRRTTITTMRRLRWESLVWHVLTRQEFVYQGEREKNANRYTGLRAILAIKCVAQRVRPRGGYTHNHSHSASRPTGLSLVCVCVRCLSWPLQSLLPPVADIQASFLSFTRGRKYLSSLPDRKLCVCERECWRVTLVLFFSPQDNTVCLF